MDLAEVNWFDAIALGLVGFGAWRGWWNGFTWEIRAVVPRSSLTGRLTRPYWRPLAGELNLPAWGSEAPSSIVAFRVPEEGG